MNEIALLGFFLHVKCWYRMFCVALFFEIHLTSAYFGRNLSFDIFFLISMEPFWIESTVSPEIVCIMFFLNIYHTVFKRKKFLHLHCQSSIGVHTEHTKYQSIEFLTLSEYHAIWGLTVVWRLIICHLHQNLEKNIYDIPYCAIHLILFENWKRFLSTFFHKMVDLSKDVALLENLKSVTFLRWEI